LSMNLCLPLASVYMLGLGLNDLQVGITASVYMFSQMVFSLLSGVIIDKTGRRKSSAIFDFIAWCIPCLIWAFAQGFWFFAVAALLNGVMKGSTVSWGLLLIEDAEKDKIAHIYTWVLILGNVSALFAPISSVMVSKLTLVPAVRILYINAFVVMTAKVILLYLISKETRQGAVRIQETRGQGLLELLAGYKGVLRQVLKSRGMFFAVSMYALIEIVSTVSAIFWQIIVSKRINVPDQWLPMFPMFRSVISILFFFAVISRINQAKLKFPMLSGYVSSFAGCVILVLMPQNASAYFWLVVSILLDSLGMAVLGTLRDTLAALNSDPKERSRVMAVLHTTVMLVSMPFGYIAGLLSEISRALPFVLNMGLLMIGGGAALLYFKRERA